MPAGWKRRAATCQVAKATQGFLTNYFCILGVLVSSLGVLRNRRLTLVLSFSEAYIIYSELISKALPQGKLREGTKF